jgi:antitoxin ParD1/3/4
MDEGETISVTLPADLVRAMRERVDAGAYASVDEIVSEAARGLLEEDEPDGPEITSYMRQAIRDSLAEPGPDIPMEEVFENLHRRLREGG